MSLDRNLRLSAGALSLSIFLASAALPANSRSQWEIQHPTLPPQQDGTFQPGQMPGQLHTGVPPQMTNNFWTGGHQTGFLNRLQPGIVLTGILENEVSSASSKAGDIFAITLEDGYVASGMQIIPRGSKIVGAVTSVSRAKSHGVPGSVQVSLQSLVLPDGSHLPFAGFIAQNPNHAYANAPKKKNLGFDIKDTGNQISGMMGSFTNGVGFLYAKRYRGNDFYMDQGEALPIRLNKTLVIPEQLVQPVATALPPGSSGMQPTMSSSLPPVAVPGLAGSDPVGQYQAPRPQQSVPGLSSDADPFNSQLAPSSNPLNSMPEPF
ncbi:MAG: hypothetical protein K2X27_03680 [Candidatus Obscuribacterales bacterium]|nr:hypothetical protein [Candidatus Obscuribacterales bacterium]